MGTGLSAAAAAALGTVLLALLVAVVLGALLVRRRIERRRVHRLRHLADQLGWSYAARDDQWIARLGTPPFEFLPFPGALSKYARRRRARNVLTGQWQGRPAAAFDYTVRAATSAGFGQVATADVRYAVCVVELPCAVPRLDIVAARSAAARSLGQAARAVGSSGIEFESEDFNRAFHVTSQSDRFASDVLNPRTMLALLGRARGTVRLAGRYASCCRQGALDARDVGEFLALLDDVVSGIPPFVWADLERGRQAEPLR